MKNIFKFMGLALIFSALTLTSCKKDEENETIPEGVEVTFGNNATWTAAATSAITNGSLFQIVAYYAENQAPLAQFLGETKTGNQSAEAIIETNEEGGYTYHAGWDNENMLAYYLEDVQFYSQTGKTDWRALDINLKVNAYDATAMTIEGTLNTTMFNYASWYNDEVTNVEDAQTKNLTVKFNTTLEMAQGKLF